MTNNVTKTIGLGVVLASALALPALAHGDQNRQGPRGSDDNFAHMMQRGGSMPGGMPGGGMMHPMMGMHGGAGGPGMPMSGGMGMAGPMAGGAMMGGAGMMGAMLDAFDADGDGQVTPDELRTGLAEKLDEYDADGDGTLSLDEFEVLHSDMIRDLVVDRFQHLDSDGDGSVTSEEITQPAEQMEQMHQLRERMQQFWPGEPGTDGPGSGMGPNTGPRNNPMMDNE